MKKKKAHTHNLLKYFQKDFSVLRSLLYEFLKNLLFLKTLLALTIQRSEKCKTRRSSQKKSRKPAHNKLKLLGKRNIEKILCEVRKNPRISIDKLRTQIIPECNVGYKSIQTTLQQNHFKFFPPSSKPFQKKIMNKSADCGLKSIRNILFVNGPQLSSQMKFILRSVFL